MTWVRDPTFGLQPESHGSKKGKIPRIKMYKFFEQIRT